MSESLDQIYSNIVSIYLDPKSYESEIKCLSELDTTQKEIIKELQNLTNSDKKTVIDDKTVSCLVSFFTAIFSSQNINFDYTGLQKYLKVIVKRPQQTKCKLFVSNINLCDKFKDDDIIPIETFFKCMSCKTCGYFDVDHSICSHYIGNNDELDCISCGMSKYKHNLCNKFTGNTDTCSTCGLEIFKHQQKELKQGKLPCNNFVESNTNNYFDCNNCIHTRTNHMINPQLFCMNDKAYSNFTDLAFHFQASYISLSPMDIMKYKNLHFGIMNMNYSKAHPHYSHFCDASIIAPTVINVKKIMV